MTLRPHRVGESFFTDMQFSFLRYFLVSDSLQCLNTIKATISAGQIARQIMICIPERPVEFFRISMQEVCSLFFIFSPFCSVSGFAFTMKYV